MRCFTFIFAFGLFLAAGCEDKSPSTSAKAENTKIKEALDKLSPEDRALAEQQKKCPIANQDLGSMGTPIKLMIKDKPVFLCCKGCEKEALAEPDATLEKVDRLKSQAGK